VTKQLCNDGRYGLSAHALKAIAIFAMLIDHMAAVFARHDIVVYGAMRFVGRLTAAIMFFFIVEGYHHTRDKNRYTLRLAVFAAISYLPFVWFAGHALPNGNPFLKLNVIYTLLIGLLAVRANREIGPLWLKTVTLCGLIALSIPGDWSYWAVFYILGFDLFRGDFKKQAYAYIFITLISIGPDYFAIFRQMFYGHAINPGVVIIALVNLGRFVPIGLLRFYNGEKGGGGKWVQWAFYLFYPLHLLVISIVAMLLYG